MTEMIDIRTCEDPRDAIHRVVERLAAGDVVGVPTETSYALAALVAQQDAVERLGRADSDPLVLSLRSPSQAIDFVSPLDAAGERLLARLLSCPVIVEVRASEESGLTGALPPAVRRAVERDGLIGLWAAQHDVLGEIQRLSASPLVLAFQPGRDPVPSVKSLLSAFNEVPSVAIEDGPPPRYGRCTRVRFDEGKWTVSEAGSVDAAEILERISVGIVFVCTGNTCRSPLAAAMFRKMLAERLNCAEEELTRHGIFVTSAGISAVDDMPAAAESLALAEEFGLKLAEHRSRPLTDDLLGRADYLFAMTSGHRDAILSVRPDLAGHVHLLSREGLDIADPIGLGPAEYERCRAEIERELLVIMDTLPIAPLKTRG
jgi:protein-tyrosine phosphatase